MEQNSKLTILGKSEGQSKNLSQRMFRKFESEAWEIPRRIDGFHASSDASLFSSSLPVLPHEKLNFDNLEHSHRSIDDSAPNLNKVDAGCLEKDQLNDVDLPDENELFAGIMDELDLNSLPNQVDDLEDYDLFGSGGGMELETEPQERLSTGISNINISDGITANSLGHHHFANGVGTVSGEHPYGEHPSRTLFVRNINSNVEDSELRSLFELYGDIRTLYTACKHRGFVMISYYDIRAARTAMRALQNKPLRRRRLDIHFSIPKDNPSEKDLNQGTLVIFNLDPSVSNDDLLQIFGAYGEVKEIRETPNKRHHKFIEYYDVRAAEAALKALNRIDIAGKRIKLEPSRPGGARRSLMQQLSQEVERDESQIFRNQVVSPVANSPPGTWAHFGSQVERNHLHTFSRSPGQTALSPVNNYMPGLASLLPTHMSNSPKLAPIGKDLGRTNNANQILTNSGSAPGSGYKQALSVSKQKPSPTSVSAFAESSSPSGIGTLSGPQFLWGSPTHRSDHSSSTWSTSSARHPFSSSGQNFPYGSRGSLLGSHQHHVGSAPSGIHLERHLGFLPESPDASLMNSVGFGGISLNHNGGNYMMNAGGHTSMNFGINFPGNVTENGSPSFRMISMPRPIFPSNGFYSGLGSMNSEGLFEHGRGRRTETNENQIGNKKQYQLDLDKIACGEETRTTLMIKNIPNKYTSKMLLAAIDEHHRGTYDFLYLPIDFKNKCNVGYAFINMVSPSHIISFYQTFDGKKWEKFNSEKVASLAYARIQGKAALVSHFQNSSLMNEDKRCRPIVFRSEGQEVDEQEHLLSSNLNICIRQPDGSYSADSLESPRSYPGEKEQDQQ